MNKKLYYTYKITLLCGSLKGHYYLGQHQTANLEDGYVGSGTRLWRYFEKYGIEEGKTYRKEILNFYSSKQELDEAEKVLIGNLYETDPFCINLKEGGSGGSDTSQMRTPEAHAKAVATKRAKYGGKATGHMETPEIKAKAKAVLRSKYGTATGRMNRPEIRAKSQATLIGRYGSVAGPMHTPEAREKANETKRAKYGTAMGKALDPAAMDRSRITRTEKYGSAAGALLFPESKAKAKKTLTERYGSPAGPLHTKAARSKAILTCTLKFGSATGQMNTPEVKAAQYSRRLRKMTVTRSNEFLEWYNPEKYGHYKLRAIDDYLKFAGKTLNDFEEYGISKSNSCTRL